MGKRYRQDHAQLNLRLKPAERDRIRKAIPHGSLNAITIQLLLDYVRALEGNSTPPPPPTVEDPAA